MPISKHRETKNITSIGCSSKGVIIPKDWFKWLDIDTEKDKLDLELNIRTGTIKITKAK